MVLTTRRSRDVYLSQHNMIGGRSRPGVGLEASSGVDKDIENRSPESKCLFEGRFNGR